MVSLRSKKSIIIISVLAILFMATGLYYGYTSYSAHQSNTSKKQTISQAIKNVLGNTDNNTSQNSSTVQVSMTATPTAIPTTTPTVSPTSDTTLNTQDIGNGLSETTDNQYNLKFKYSSQMDNGGVQTSLIVNKSGNKIMLYPQNSHGAADYIKVFSKNPGDTLTQAITKTT